MKYLDNSMQRLFPLILCWLSFTIEGYNGSSISNPYPLKQRTRQAQTLVILSRQDVGDIGLSWSDDSPSKSLQQFSLNLFTTDGSLPLQPSILSVQEALDNFLISELNSRYGWANQVRYVRSRVLTQSSTASGRQFTRKLQTSGSTLVTAVDIFFKYEPSPNVADVEAVVFSILKGNLSPLLSNLTQIASGDSELAQVDSIYYFENSAIVPPTDLSPVSAPVTAPSLGAVGSGSETPKDSGITNPSAVVDEEERYVSQGPNLSLIVPLVTVCFLLIVIALFTQIRERSRNTVVNASLSGSDQALMTNHRGARTFSREIVTADEGVNLCWDGESGIFSIEAMLVDTPKIGYRNKNRNHLSPSSASNASRNQDSQYSTDHSDIFSGINVETESTYVDESPRSGRRDSRSLFSWFSGMASRGDASTVVHSNVTKQLPRYSSSEVSPMNSEAILGIKSPNGYAAHSEGETPKSRISSLFTFSEEDTADLCSSGEENDVSKSSRALGERKLVTIPDDESMMDQSINERSTNENALVAENIREATIQSNVDIPDSTASNMGAVTQGYDTDQSSTYIRSPESNASASPPISEKQENQSSPISSKNEINRSITDDPNVSSNLNSSGIKGSEKRALNDPYDTAKKRSWSRFLSPFKTDSEDRFASTPKSLGSIHEKDTPDVDEGYGTDPGLTGVTTSEPHLENHPKGNSARSRYWKDAPGSLAVSDLNNFEDEAEGSPWKGSDEEDGSSPSGGLRSRRHTKNPTGDGTNKYQHETMGDWSVTDYTMEQDITLNDPTSAERTVKRRPLTIAVTEIEVNTSSSIRKQLKGEYSPRTPSYRMSPSKTPKSTATNDSAVSALSNNTRSIPSDGSGSKQLISDLVWLEKKINATTNTVVHSPRKSLSSPPALQNFPDEKDIDHCDSLSFNSDDIAPSASHSSDSNSVTSEVKRTTAKKVKKTFKLSPAKVQDTVHSIICRDCYAPPGKLKIVIHSTKDGPAVHTVKRGSTLEGHIFPGDLIISVDNVDTRSYSAEQVMKMMTANAKFERKITVLHFEQTTESSVMTTDFL